MNLKQLISKSVYGTIGYISSQEDLDVLEQYIVYNLPVLKEFKRIAVFTNYKDYSDTDLILKNNALWTRYFPNCVYINNPINRGHNFGTADLDNLVFDYCKLVGEEWLCKSANDIIVQESILNKEVEEADFYYMNGIGYTGMAEYDFDFDRILDESFYPQTNLYFINVSKTDYLTDKIYLDETYQYSLTIPNYNGKIWEYISGWSCENFLKQCVERNNLSKYNWVSQEKYRNLLQIIKDFNFHDCSHKNIMIEGVCHLQHPQNQIIEI
jgi:hypothetical protein